MPTLDPPLTSAVERELCARWRAGDARAADRLVTANQRLVVVWAIKYHRTGVPIDDLVQEGNVGLLVALRKFEPERGLRFMTYAIWWVRAYMLNRIRGEASVVHRSSKQERPIADSSLDAPWMPGADENLVDRLPDDAPGAEVGRMHHEEAARVRDAMKVLDRREREIVTRRFFADEPWTLQRLAYRYHLSRERVRQLEARALKKLKKRLASEWRQLAASEKMSGEGPCRCSTATSSPCGVSATARRSARARRRRGVGTTTRARRRSPCPTCGARSST